MPMAGELYVVATPIGNLGDITLRAVEVLKRVDLVLAEDTRRTRKLLSHLGISCRVVSCYGSREGERISLVKETLEAGGSAALVTDAGTPTLSDPGSLLISKVWDAGYKVVPLPGPSALLAALMASGLEPGPFVFWGFPPRKRGELAAFLRETRMRQETSVFYESPNRLLQTLKALLDEWGDRFSVVAVELTNLHEEFVRGRLSHQVEHFSEVSPKGEIVLIVEGGGDGPREDAKEEEGMFERLVEGGLTPRDAAKAMRILFAIPKDKVYKWVQRQKEE